MSTNTDPLPNFVIRPFDPIRDVLRLLHFFNALEVLEGDPNPSTEAHVRSQMNWRGHNPKRDRWVIEHPNNPATIVGHAWIFTQTSQRAACKVAIHPDWQRQGLGSSLLARVLQRAQALGICEIVSGCDAADQAALSFLVYHGFQARSTNWFLSLSASTLTPEPIWPLPYTVQQYAEIEHLPTLVNVLNRSYHDILGHAENEAGVVTVESVATMVGQTLVPEDVFLVFESPTVPIGVCRLRLHGRSDNMSGVDILDAPGIVPEYRHLHLHIPLALTAIHWQRQHSQRDLMLEAYGDPEAVITDYQAMGFQLQSRFIEYIRPVS